MLKQALKELNQDYFSLLLLLKASMAQDISRLKKNKEMDNNRTLELNLLRPRNMNKIRKLLL